MLLVIDIGNTTMEFGIYDGDKSVGVFRLGSKRDISSDEVGLFVTQFFEYKQIPVEAVSDIVISSVVPQLNYSVGNAIRKYFQKEPKIIGETLFCNIVNLYENPREVGSDRLVDAYAAIHRYGAPAVVVDFGTATTCDAISAKGEYLGGIIYPGIKTSMDALYEKAAKLPKIELVRPDFTIGKNTVASMQSGAYFGYLGAVEKIVNDMKKILGEGTKVIATGGFSKLYASETDVFDFVDPSLALEGIKMIFEAAPKEV